jgi:1-deoxy-D-xylulose-5-phosphate synthase
MTVMAPKDENELQHMIYTALQQPGPVAIRYPRGNGVGVTLDTEYKAIPVGQAEMVKEGKDLMILALGNMVRPALEAAEDLEKEGISASVMNCRFVKPLDKKIAEHAETIGKVLVVEENIRQGGFGGAVLEMFDDVGLRNIRIKRIGLPDKFIEHGPSKILREKYGLDVEGILKEAKELLKGKKLKKL